MADSYKMTQCVLEKAENDQTVYLTSWIPSAKARLGKMVKLKEVPGQWQVIQVGSEMDSEDVVESSSDYRRHRKATDI